MAQPDLQPIADPGGLFVRLGRIFKIIEVNRTWQITTAQTETDNVMSQFEDGTIHDIDFIPGFERSMYNTRRGRDSLTALAVKTAKDAMLETLNAVDTLYQTDENTVLDYLVRLMDDNATNPAGAATLDRPVVAVGAEDPHPDNIGDGHMAITPVNLDGLQNPYVRAEDIDFVITSKNSTDKGTMQKRGFPIRSNRTDYKWPGGSGSGTAIKVVDQKTDAAAASVAPGNNVLGNSDFEDFTANLPDKWEADEGVAGTDFGLEATNEFEGTNCLRFIGTAASIAPRIRQKFNDNTDGTIGNLKADTKYCVHFWYRSLNASTQGTGNFEVRVKIGSLSASFTKALADVWPTTYTQGTVFINTPATISATGVNFALFVGVATGGDMTLAEEIFIDFMCMTECVESGNLFMIAVNGLTDYALDDRITIPITNTGLVGGGSDAKFPFYLDLCYDLWGSGRIIHDAVVPNVEDTLIV